MLCVGMFLVCLVIGLPIAVFSSRISVAELIRSLVFGEPWWQLFLFATLGFGISMMVIDLISRRRG